MRVLFLGFALPEDRFRRFMDRETGMPAQTQRFGTAVVDALVLGGANVEVVSAAPATNYPHHRRVFFRCRTGVLRGVRAIEIPFVNLTVLKHLTRYVAALTMLRRRRFPIPDGILVHGVHSPFLWAALHVGGRMGCPVIVILTDAPSLVTRFDGRVSGALKRIDRRLIESALLKVDGVVSLAPRLAEDFAPGVRVLRMEGIATDVLEGPPAISPAMPPRIVYAGGLREEYGVGVLLDAVGLSDGDWELHLYGRGPIERIAKERALLDSRVHVHGLVGRDELRDAYAGSSLLINPRPVDQAMVEYSFPSKLLEYLGTGRPVMTTRLPTIPDDYLEHVLCTPDSAEGMADAIDDFLGEPLAMREARGSLGRQFVERTRSPAAQGRRLVEFISGSS